MRMDTSISVAGRHYSRIEALVTSINFRQRHRVIWPGFFLGVCMIRFLRLQLTSTGELFVDSLTLART